MRAYNLLFSTMFLICGTSAQAQFKNPEQQAEIQEKTKEALKSTKQKTNAPMKLVSKKNGQSTETEAKDKNTLAPLRSSNKKTESIKVKPLTPKEFQERAIVNVQKMVQSRIEAIRDKANTTTSADRRNVKGYVLSTYLKSFPDITPTIGADIKETKASIRKLIKIVANDIEMQGEISQKLKLKDDGNLEYIPASDLSKSQNLTREKLLKANLQNNISVRTASIAIQLLVNINEALLQEAKQAKNNEEKQIIYTTQAIHIYELTDIILVLLADLDLHGQEAISKLYSDAKIATTDRIAEINIQIKRAYDLKEAGMMNKKQLRNEEENYEALKKINVERLTVWDVLLDNIAKQASFIEGVKKNKALLIYKRDKAKLQLNTLKDLRGIDLKNAIGSLAKSEVAKSVKKLELSTLNEEEIRSLLGYSTGL